MSEPEKDIRRSIGAVGKVKSINASGAMGERPSKKLKLDGTAASSGDNGRNGTLKSAAVFNVINKASRPAAADTAEPNGGGYLAEEFDGSSNSKKSKSKCLDSGSGAAVASENNGGGKFCKELIGTSSDFSKKLKSKCVGFGFAAAFAAETNGRGKLGKEIVGTSNSIYKNLGSEGTMEDKSNERLPMTSLKLSLSIEIEAYGSVKEVTRRPETHWNARMKAAQDRGTLALLQNLDQAYTSSEVEDIVWHGMGESCTAKVVQRTATPSPHSGKAFVMFKTREAAEKVSYKLDQECLMLPNRPLVGSPWVASFAGKQSSFPGHLVIDKLKHQLQCEAYLHHIRLNQTPLNMKCQSGAYYKIEKPCGGGSCISNKEGS